MIDFKKYQDLSSRTINYSLEEELALANWAMGLAGEAGETVDALKKVLFHGHSLNKDKIAEELGDVLWYVSAICNNLGLSMEQIAFDNVMKLKKRYPERYSNFNSINRDD